MSERTIKTSKVGFKWLAYYTDNPGVIGMGPCEVAAIQALQNIREEDSDTESKTADG